MSLIIIRSFSIPTRGWIRSCFGQKPSRNHTFCPQEIKYESKPFSNPTLFSILFGSNWNGRPLRTPQTKMTTIIFETSILLPVLSRQFPRKNISAFNKVSNIYPAPYENGKWNVCLSLRVRQNLCSIIEEIVLHIAPLNAMSPSSTLISGPCVSAYY